MTLLQVRNLSIQFHGSDTPTVHQLSFDIEKGKTTALVGESGSGKSITALSLLRLNPALWYPEGEILFEEKNLLQAPEKALQRLRGNRIGMIFQEPMTALNPLHNINKQLREALTLHQPRLSRKEQASRIMTALEEVGLSHLQKRLHHYPHQLSGGERQRLMIAMAVINRPALLIADEPTTALDVTTQSKIMDLLQELQLKYEMSLLLITHDLHIVRDIASQVVVMQKGRAVEMATTQQLFKTPRHPYTQTLLASRHAAFAESITTEDRPDTLSCSRLTVSYKAASGFQLRRPPQKQIIPETNLTVKAGETLGIVGESGSGKTTLGLALARLIPSEGDIIFQRQAINGFSTTAMRPLRHHLQFVFQDPFSSLNPRMTIGQIIMEGLEIHHPIITAEEKKRQVETILRQVELEADVAPRYPHEFSGGQRQRINIARAMILNPACVIFDEPTSALDITLQTQIIHLLKQFQAERRMSYIFISHDIHVIQSISHHLMVLKNGKVVEYGRTKEVLSTPQHAYTQTLIQASGICDE